MDEWYALREEHFRVVVDNPLNELFGMSTFLEFHD